MINRSTPAAVLRLDLLARHHPRISRSSWTTSTAGYSVFHSFTCASEIGYSAPVFNGMRHTGGVEPLAGSALSFGFGFGLDSDWIGLRRHSTPSAVT